MNIDSPEFQERFLADLRAADDRGPLVLELDALSALTLVGHLQLALRHPANRGRSAAAAQKVIDSVVAGLGVTETLRAGLRAGADPRHDTPPPSAAGTAVVRPTVVCLCGSTRFWRTFQEVQLRETLCGRIVLSIGSMTAGDGEHGITPEQKAMLDELHLRKIDLADEVLILNAVAPVCAACGKACQVGGVLTSACCRAAVERRSYVGDSTRRELAYARSKGKRVRFLEPSEGLQ